MYRLNRETSQDRWEVEALYDLCFAPGRTALSSYRLREGVPPVANLCLVARDPDGFLAGAIRFWPVRVGRAEALLLGPVAVHPTRQGEGLGGLLMREGLARAQADRWPRVLLVGDEPYYGRFGFTRPDISFDVREHDVRAIIVTGACVLPLVIVVMTEASATDSPPMPLTASSGLTTAPSSVPIRAVETGWKIAVEMSPAAFSRASSPSTSGPGLISVGLNSAIRRVAMSARAWRIESTATRWSARAER